MNKKIFTMIIVLLSFFAHALQTRAQTSTNEARIETIIQKMTLEEKIDFIGGQDFLYSRFSKLRNSV